MAEFARREVLIPMVGGASLGALARVAADGKLPGQHPAQLDREISELLECGLYQAGQQAKAAVRCLRRRGGGVLGPPPTALCVVNPGDTVGLGAENSASAELGLALCLLMFQAQTDETTVLASGALDLGAGAQARVAPVRHLARKLELTLQHFSQPGAARPPRWFLVPTTEQAALRVMDTHAARIAQLRALGIHVRGVESLADAARIIGASRIALRNAERWTRRALAAASALAVASAAAAAWLESSLPLHFISGASTDGGVIMTPARVIRAARSVTMTAPCAAAPGLPPAFEIGNELAVRVRVDRPRYDLAMHVGGYHYAAVAVSETSKPRVVRPHGSTDDTAEWTLDVLAPAENTLLLILARRGMDFDFDALAARLDHLRATVQPQEWESAARDFLHRAAPGMLAYRFRAVAAGSCPWK